MKNLLEKHQHNTRRRLLKILAAVGVTGPLALELVAQSRKKISMDIVRNAAAIRGEDFSEERLQVIETALQRNLDEFQIVRDLEIDDLIEPAPIFISTRHAADVTAKPGGPSTPAASARKSK